MNHRYQGQQGDDGRPWWGREASEGADGCWHRGRLGCRCHASCAYWVECREFLPRPAKGCKLCMELFHTSLEKSWGREVKSEDSSTWSMRLSFTGQGAGRMKWVLFPVQLKTQPNPLLHLQLGYSLLDCQCVLLFSYILVLGMGAPGWLASVPEQLKSSEVCFLSASNGVLPLSGFCQGHLLSLISVMTPPFPTRS